NIASKIIFSVIPLSAALDFACFVNFMQLQPFYWFEILLVSLLLLWWIIQDREGVPEAIDFGT
ncbi:MAG: hypothetical protein QXU38_03110, partial [Candidatus Bathyarchaeia archaeon]